MNNLSGSKILVTGHTGFKGSWLCKILSHFDVEVFGISLAPEKNSLFSRTTGLKFSESIFMNINNFEGLEKSFKRLKPDFVIHLAARALVRDSYESPLDTFRTNVLGTANVLQTSSIVQTVKGVLAITTDKVYKNIETMEGYKEDDALGGKDPYSASKSAAEMAISAWRSLPINQNDKKIVAARSGNVIGGGDHARDRILPDLIRGFRSNTQVAVRNPSSLRPWQHVLDPLFGYLELTSKMLGGEMVKDSYNFGPSEESKLTVGEIADYACAIWPHSQGWRHEPDQAGKKEAELLWLNSTRAFEDLGWRNQLAAREAIEWTIDWEKLADQKGALYALDEQIHRYRELRS